MEGIRSIHGTRQSPMRFDLCQQTAWDEVSLHPRLGVVGTLSLISAGMGVRHHQCCGARFRKTKMRNNLAAAETVDVCSIASQFRLPSFDQYRPRFKLETDADTCR